MKNKNELSEIFNQNEQSLTRGQQKAKIEQVKGLLAKFKSNHSKILAAEKPDTPYIVNESGEKTIGVVGENLAKMKKLLSTDSILPIIPTAAARQVQVDQKIRLEKLQHKLASLEFSVQQAQNEFLTEASVQKEFFDLKQKFSFELSNSIASLEEEIGINYCEEASPEVTRACREVYGLMNACIKTMSAMIIQTTQASQSVSIRDTKLLDLKVTIFKEDYKQWKNFKDIFESLIQVNLPTVRKMEYSKTYLEGEPLRLISAFTLSAENYKDAYDTLKKRYDHKRKLFMIHLV